jgi:CheY-like chemotaxis protein
MTALVIDDERLARNELKRLLQAHAAIEVAGEAAGVDEGLALIESVQPDLIFLDVQMPGANGFDLLNRLASHTPRVIFTTAFERFALRAFEVNALDLRLERALPFDSKRTLPSCTGGSRAAPHESCAGPWAYLQQLDEHKSHLSLEELSLLAEALQRFLDSEGNRQAIGDLDELREAVDRVEAYRAFQPERFDRRALNRQLRALAHEREVRP